ncbi:ubiquinol oxidase subunit II [Pseudoxanthobacter sp.]|uniref:ubiquinol oxidase subunit II n=1 Tax=Pseudoxanthobacter sp. TaxID=1925742 RepID=UPI002FE05D30
MNPGWSLLSQAAKVAREPLGDEKSLRRKALRAVSSTAALTALTLLGGCQWAILDPKGPIGEQEKNLILIATALMLLVVVPVIVMTIAFAWRYRASNTKATYKPDWEHSTAIEVVVWGIPVVIIVALAGLTWHYTHKLDPYQAIKSDTPALNVEVVALDWKWLFIYPDQGVASVNEVAFPVNTPVNFKVTSDSVMNSFFIPDLGSQIYAMAGMQTKVSLLADQTGTFRGISANYSGAGFAKMSFKALSLSDADFAKWVDNARAATAALDDGSYLALSKPSEGVPVAYYGSVTPDLYTKILDMCVDAAKCTVDPKKLAALLPLSADDPLCTPENPKGL